ncbi:FliA/WhiG family RNA polymerase sigma factor [Pseudoflavonifractor sp. 60]|uniref:sigma-70 family RNA polymerase sigma factor n=1 Tax=Pseudoflavonifractor sp. 60 TaxID=2304576 RepID=UPI00136A58D1|nr:FliA/WhiG family RNA polymerase sigma factor [Pseudoflavonifractor sp. 60]MCI8914283.1 FliA/WhiG family RNA polymerase sigma factor [Lawsonibacter sp.]NBI68052.1 FliA/WhiG family RNA polymerase sigma factor [Pseudoflavonifractor sp. 60]
MSGAAERIKEGLTEEQLEELSAEELFQLYKSTGDPELKWPLIMRYVGLVRSIALQVRGVYSSFAQVDDIVNEGLLTLAAAVDKFDPDKGIKFETYVSKRIRGAVIDLARRQDWVPRSVRRKARDIDQASSELFAELGRYPTDREMAERLGVSQDQYQEDLANSSMCNVLSLDALFEDREQTGRAELPDDASESRPEDSMLRQELLETLTKAIESLRENEQTVISLYYHKNLSMKEIAQVMEVSEPRISQLHSRAIQKLKLYMNQYMTGDR